MNRRVTLPLSEDQSGKGFFIKLLLPETFQRNLPYTQHHLPDFPRSASIQIMPWNHEPLYIPVLSIWQGICLFDDSCCLLRVFNTLRIDFHAFNIIFDKLYFMFLFLLLLGFPTAPAGFKRLAFYSVHLNLSYPVSRCYVAVLLSLSVLPSTFAVVLFP